MFDHLTVDGVIKESRRYRLIDGLLYRLVEVSGGGYELRICAPTGSDRAIFALVGLKPMPFRRELIYHYHNGLLGQHTGREQTLLRISGDWYWRQMRSDVESWCDSCAVCKSGHGVPTVSAWTRTTLYTHPFRCLQFDTVDCGQDNRTGHKYLLTVICLFSRWCWAIPLFDKNAPEIGDALMQHVFGPWGIWSTVLRSDNAREFLARTIAYINSKLETEHITGPVYHPQAQGAVERMHRKINDFMRAIFSWVIDEKRDNWVAYIPFVVGMLRTMKMASLGNRSPMMIVTGLDPKLPITIAHRLPVSEIGVDEYVLQLMKYLKKLVQCVTRAWNWLGKPRGRSAELPAHL